MRRDLDAALRIMAQCRVRTITRERKPEPKPAAPVKRPHIITGKGRGGQNRRGIIIEGKRYATFEQAAFLRGCSKTSIYKLIDAGLATYEDGNE